MNNKIDWVTVTYLPKLVLEVWLSPDQTRDEQRHRTTAYKKHRAETDHPSVVTATCYKQKQLIITVTGCFAGSSKEGGVGSVFGFCC